MTRQPSTPRSKNHSNSPSNMSRSHSEVTSPRMDPPRTPRSPSSRRGDNDSEERRRPTKEEEEEERQERVDELIYTMNDVANDGQDLAMELRELICDQPAVSSLAQDLASNLSTFGRTLRELALYLGTPAAPFAMTTIEVVEVTLEYAEDLFNQVDDMMYKFDKDPDHDFIYCFKDTKVLKLSSKLESSRLTLAVILQVLQLRALMNLQSMEDGDDKALRHRIKDLRLEAQSLVLDETWARRKEKLLEENGISEIAKDDAPIMPKHTMTEAAAAVTVLLDNLTEPYKGEQGSRGNDGKRSIGDTRGLPDNCPPDGSHEKRKQILETLAKAALAAGVLGAWRSRSKVPLPKSVKRQKDNLARKAKPKHGASILSGLGGKIEAIAPVALAAGAYEVFKNRNEDRNGKEKAQRFMNATKGAAFGAVGGK